MSPWFGKNLGDAMLAWEHLGRPFSRGTVIKMETNSCHSKRLSLRGLLPGR
jgi:hypothetical protein